MDTIPAKNTPLTPQERDQIMAEANQRIRDKRGGKPFPVTALDAKLNRGAALMFSAAFGQSLASALPHTPLIKSPGQTRHIEAESSHETSPAAQPLTVLPQRAWLLRGVNGSATGVCCSNSIKSALQKSLNDIGLETFRGNFYKFIGHAEVPIYHFKVTSENLSEDVFTACIDQAEEQVRQAASSPENLNRHQALRREECKCLADEGIDSASRLIGAANRDSGLFNDDQPSIKSAGLGPEFLWHSLPKNTSVRPPHSLADSPNALLLFEDDYCGGRTVYLWKSRGRALWLCNRVRHEDGFYSTRSQANHSSPIEQLYEINYDLEPTFGYSLTDLSIDPMQIFAWLMSGSPAFEKQCRIRAERQLVPATK